MRLFRLLCGLLIACAAGLAHADIYGYIDSEGNAHFAAEQLDQRYQLFLRGDGPFDSGALAAPKSMQSTQRAPREPGSNISAGMQAYLTRHPGLLKYEALLAQAAKEHAVELPLLKAVMAAESGFNPAAISPKGAIGLMQVMPATAERYGLQADRRKTVEQKLSDPKTNIHLAARYLRDLMRRFPGELTLVLASYNAGEGAVQKYRGQVPPYPETRNYVKLVTQFYQLYKPAPSVDVAAAAEAAPGGQARRVYLTIPGRGNLPTLRGTEFQAMTSHD
jgi:soluble lytic murein transglycosylase-like protein